jgi:hypothetical protein
MLMVACFCVVHLFVDGEKISTCKVSIQYGYLNKCEALHAHTGKHFLF